MASGKKVRLIEKLFLVACIMLILYSGVQLFRSWWLDDTGSELPEITVKITGNIKTPGEYKIPFGSTVFELLQVSGIKTTSDINDIKLAGELVNGQSVHVGRLNTGVNVRKNYMTDACVLDFFKGSVAIKDKSGIKKDPSMGLLLSAGDKLSCGREGQMQLKMKDNSLIIINGGSSVVLEKIGAQAGDKISNVFMIKKGGIWGKIMPQGISGEFRFKTPHMLAYIRGTEFVIDVNSTESDFELYKGLVYLQNRGASEGVNLNSGERIKTRGKGYSLKPEKIINSFKKEKFRQLKNERDLYYKKRRSISILLCGVPNTYIFFKMDPIRKKILLMHIPSNTWIGNIASGCNEFDKAFLYGGAKFSMSIAERFLRTKVSKYIVCTVKDVRRIIDLVGGITVDVDSRAASVLSVAGGSSHLDGYEATRFMSPTISGSQEARERQRKVLISLFEGIRDKNILLSSQIIGRIIGNTDTNLSIKEALELFSMFNSVKGWRIQTITMPGKSVLQNGKMFLRPLAVELSKLFH